MNEEKVDAVMQETIDHQAQEVARLRAGIQEAIGLINTEPLTKRVLWMPVRDVLTDALEVE